MAVLMFIGHIKSLAMKLLKNTRGCLYSRRVRIAYAH